MASRAIMRPLDLIWSVHIPRMLYLCYDFVISFMNWIIITLEYVYAIAFG